MQLAFDYAATLTHEKQQDFAEFLTFHMSQHEVSAELMKRIIDEHKAK